MDESVKPCAKLEVSVSFGRFDSDELHWGKWSYFSPNTYLDEVGNLSTPGSVAQKKAYFEAHYNRKAEELEQETSMDVASLSLDESRKNVDVHVQDSFGIDTEIGLSKSEELIIEVAQEVVNEAKDDYFGPCEGVEQEVTIREEEKECAKDELNSNVVDHELDVRLDGALVEVEIRPEDSRQIKNKSQERKNDVEQSTSLRTRNSKSNARHVGQKVSLIQNERNLPVTKKKVVPPQLPMSTTRHAKKTTSTSTTLSTLQYSKNKLHGSPLPKTNNYLGRESKRESPSSLHMSLNLDPRNSSSALPMTRKSLIIEKTGDKDVVSRAFKNFQSHTNGSPAKENSNSRKQVLSNTFKTKISSTVPSKKGNERQKKDAEIQRSQSGATSKHLPSKSQKSSVVDKKKTSAASPSVGLRSDERAEKPKEKLEAKSVTREAKNAKQLSAKSKEEKESEAQLSRKSRNFKAKPLPSFYRGQRNLN